MGGLDHKNVFELGPNIYFCAVKDRDCVHSSKVSVTRYSSAQELVTYMNSYHKMSVGLDEHSFNVAISRATGSQTTDHWFEDTLGSIGVTMNKQRCHALREECFLGNDLGVKLNKDFMANLLSLPVDVLGQNETLLQLWRKQVILTRGTHVCIGTDNGAAMKYVTSIQSSGKSESECLFSETCAQFGAFGFDTSVCAGARNCSVAKQFDSIYQHHCSAVGGGSGFIATQLCDPTLAIADRWKFINSGDLDSEKSVIEMHFRRLDEMVQRYGMDEQAQTLKIAIDYHMCISTGSDAWQWGTSAGGTGVCMCMRKCENGGDLDFVTCTCRCKGDLWHGWSGPTCTETYGQCQPGEGTGNPAAAQKCLTQNGYCSSANPQGTRAICSPTEVCCLTDFKGLCCPLGSRCSCGSFDCQCMAGNDTAVI